MKLKTLLVLGVAGTAVYFYVTREGRRQAEYGADQAPLGAPGNRRAPARLAQKLKDTVTGRRNDGPADTLRPVSDERSAPNDLALARQVEETLSLNPHFSRGRVLVNADAGRITLRGTTDIGEDITEFEQTARSVPGVTEVNNLLHIQGTTAPSRHRGGLASDAVDQTFAATER